MKAYKLWAGKQPPKELTVLHAGYWESSHWTKEYLSFMELQTTATWRQQFVLQNNLVYDSTASFPISGLPPMVCTGFWF